MFHRHFEWVSRLFMAVLGFLLGFGGFRWFLARFLGFWGGVRGVELLKLSSLG